MPRWSARGWLPKDAAHEVNPAERIWGLMKDDGAANRLARSIEELVEAARRFFRALTPHPVTLPAPPPRLVLVERAPALSMPAAA